MFGDTFGGMISDSSHAFSNINHKNDAELIGNKGGKTIKYGNAIIKLLVKNE